MGYGYYLLPDGREAGYGVEAECDHPGCDKRIDRGLGYLCGREPLGWNDFDAPGCGNYYCGQHEFTHECANPACEVWSEDGERDCVLARGHDDDHRDYFGASFSASPENPASRPVGGTA